MRLDGKKKRQEIFFPRYREDLINAVIDGWHSLTVQYCQSLSNSMRPHLVIERNATRREFTLYLPN